ncbi:hypothetical protein HF292_008015 [Acidithiobacillus ferruginosus]|uniref:Uncharacterized protein n=1 Tax=Acidithiobacillus ferruginosus TaxID=3063951 RepID=A0ACD5ID53_9PROT|nr:hypothetical protein [Acidithiobacillus ferruginosus]MBU2813265.1 hypothetical protein [Acidithiobacillus ferruginosus]
MNEPVSFDLFSPDIFPEVSQSRRFAIARDELLYLIRQFQELRLKCFPCALPLARARVLLDLMGGLGGVC